MAEARHDRLTEIEDRYAGYQVYAGDYEKIGKIEELFVDGHDEPEYIGVKMGFLGMRSTLIPFELVRINDERELAEVASDKETVKNGPSFDDDQEITPGFEERVRSYYGLALSESNQEPAASGYGAYYSGSRAGSAVDTEYGEHAGKDRHLDDREAAGSAGPGMSMGDREGGGFREHPPAKEGVRKRVRTDRERMIVPKRREEVRVDRVPVEGEASGPRIGEDEVRVPATEEEIEVSKRPVQKEEIRIRKEAVEEEEVIEEDVRKVEVDVDDDSEHR